MAILDSILFCSPMPSVRTCGDMLRFAVAFALRGARKLVRGLPKQRGFALLTTSFTSFNSTVTLGGSKTRPRQAKITPHEDEFAVGAAFVCAVGGTEWGYR